MGIGMSPEIQNVDRDPVFWVLDIIEGPRLSGNWRLGQLGGRGSGVGGRVSQAGIFSL